MSDLENPIPENRLPENHVTRALVLHAQITALKLKSDKRVIIQMATVDGQEVDVIDVTMGLTQEVLGYQIGDDITIAVTKRTRLMV